VRPQALPSRRIVQIADDLLGRDGQMTAVIEEHLAEWRREGIARAARAPKGSRT
jgi:hypothetical protein